MPDQALPIVVLTLEAQAERRRPLVRQLEALGLEYTLHFGVDGRSGLDPSYESFVDRSTRYGLKPRTLTDAEWACAISHSDIYRRIVAEQIPMTIILEDDAIVGSAFATFARGEIPLPGDLILFDHWKGSVRPERRTHLIEDIYAYPIVLAPSLATGYALTRRGAQTILDRSTPLRGPADWPCDITRLDTQMVHPRIVDHPVATLEHSGIEGDRRKNAEVARRRDSPLSRLLQPAHWRHALRKARSSRLEDRCRLDLAPAQP